jgi:hypothetical protein
MLGTRRFSPGSAAACMAMAVMAMACNPDSATTGPSGLNGKDFAANLRLIAGDQQLGSIGSALTQPLIVRVVDAGGQPVAGATVTFSVRQGGGSVNPAANVSGPDGTVTATWTMGSSLGPNRAVALLSNQFLLDSAVFTATATTGPANRFTKVSGDSQTGVVGQALAAPLVVRVQDAFGNSLSGVRVTWTPSLLNGSVTFTADTTAADGTASAIWRLGTGATGQNLVASVAGIPTTINFFATATADNSATSTRLVTVTAIPAATAPASTLAGTLTIRVQDQFGNNLAGVPITWNDSVSGGGTLSANTGVTNALGAASTTWTLGRRLGNQAVRARLTGRTETVLFTSAATIAFSEVVAGNSQACARSAVASAVYCWGSGDDGQLGKGGTASSTEPSAAVVQAGDTLTGQVLAVRQLTSGRNGFCGLTIARTLYCWGRTLGGPGVNSPASITLTASGAPVLPNGAFLGEDFGCLVSLVGDPFCGGNNLNGQLGDGGAPTGTAVGTWVVVSHPGGIVPATVNGTPLFSAISLGRGHGCAIPRLDASTALLLDATQRVYCWGQNNAGQLGNNTTTSSAVPVSITGPGAAAGIRYDSTALAAGATHTCAVEGTGSVSAGRLWCWGSNGSGQAGAALTTVFLDEPTIVAGAPVLARVYAGEFHSCGLTAAGAAVCWGRNDFGQLGTGASSVAPITTPTAVVGPAGSFRSLTLGEDFTCGVSGTPGQSSQVAGTVYCWGNNQFGQLGTSNTTAVATPTRVSFQP